MKRESIGVHTIVEAKLTPFGAHVLAEYLNAETERATGVPNPKRDENERRVPALRDIEMPLWELFKVFGPHTVSSARLPFEDLNFGRAESREERTCTEAERQRTRANDDLRSLAQAVGIADAYKAPEVVSHVARQFSDYVPPRVPTAAGWWWLGEDVVKVSEKDGDLTARINNRRKKVSDDQPWRGPAIIDARVRKDDNEDIPF